MSRSGYLNPLCGAGKHLNPWEIHGNAPKLNMLTVSKQLKMQKPKCLSEWRRQVWEEGYLVLRHRSPEIPAAAEESWRCCCLWTTLATINTAQMLPSTPTTPPPLTGPQLPPFKCHTWSTAAYVTFMQQGCWGWVTQLDFVFTLFHSQHDDLH